MLQHLQRQLDGWGGKHGGGKKVGEGKNKSDFTSVNKFNFFAF